ncbi:MAG: hypothetical protein JO165_03625 [Candidatus Eremiobacteraeota bacterium]|nr:hypothetical protein [Candidatus Eremiobacteraeota bacterium]
MDRTFALEDFHCAFGGGALANAFRHIAEITPIPGERAAYVAYLIAGSSICCSVTEIPSNTSRLFA